MPGGKLGTGTTAADFIHFFIFSLYLKHLIKINASSSFYRAVVGWCVGNGNFSYITHFIMLKLDVLNTEDKSMKICVGLCGGAWTAVLCGCTCTASTVKPAMLKHGDSGVGGVVVV